MPDKILHKRNLTTGNIPTTSSLEPGELAINVADGKLFLRQSGSAIDQVVTVGLSSSYASTASYIQTAQTASYITSSNVYGPFGSNSIVSASYADTASFSTAASANQILVLNQSGQNIAKGVVVHITGSNTSSDIPRVITASFESDLVSANTLGIASQLITAGTTGFVTTEGVVTGIDTSAFISGQLVYLGATGSIIGTAPLAPTHSVRLGQVVRHQSNNGSIYVRIDNGYELGELHDVLITGSATGDLLVRSGSVWINSKQLSGSYSLTGSLTATSFTGSLFGTATTASYVLQAVSSSFATSASYAPTPYGAFGIANSSGSYTYYTTFSASIAAATSGQTVEMFADVTETTNIAIALKNGVNINGNGYTYTLNQAGTANCIQDGGVAVNCVISNITIRRLGGTPSSTNTLCMYITGASRIKAYSTTLLGGATNMRCLTINNASAEVFGIYAEGYNPVATITNGTIYNSEFRSINGGGMTVEANGTAIKCVAYGYGADGLTSAGKIIDCVGYGALNNGISVSAGLVQNCIGYGGGGAGIYLNGSTIVAINSTGYSVAGAGLFTSSPTSIDLKGYSSAGAGISMINGSLFDSIGYSTSTNGILANNSGANITELRSCKAISTTAAAINMNNTTSGCKIYNTEAYSKWNNAAGHGIVVAGANAEIVQCTMEVTNASANCISGSSALTTKYANNAFKGSTIAVNANITQGMINTHDNFGNIII